MNQNARTIPCVQPLTGGQTHWRDQPIRHNPCILCKGWGVVKQRTNQTFPQLAWIPCGVCGQTGRQDIARTRAKAAAA